MGPAPRSAYDAGVNTPDPKTTLVEGLAKLQAQVLGKLAGLSEYDLRRPVTPTGTNLLGVVKHLASVQAGYFGATFGRPFPQALPWLAEDADTNADMWVTPDESTASITDLYRASWEHAQETIDGLELGLPIDELPPRERSSHKRDLRRIRETTLPGPFQENTPPKDRPLSWGLVRFRFPATAVQDRQG